MSYEISETSREQNMSLENKNMADESDVMATVFGLLLPEKKMNEMR